MTDRDDYREAVEQADIRPKDADMLPPAVRALDAPAQPPVRFLVHDLLPLGEIVLLVGDGGAFKSSAALHIGAAIAGGYQAFGSYSVIHGPVLVVSNEDSLGVVIMRLEAYCAGHGWKRERVLGNVHIIAESEPNLSDAAWRFHLVHEIERLQPAFVILDPWFEVVGCDENSNSDVRPVVKFLRSLTRTYGCTVAVVHHAGKSSPDKRTLDRIRGATSLPHASRAILFFEYLDSGIRVENVKMSRSPRIEPFMIKRAIDHERDNRAQWTSARLTLADARSEADQRAEQFIVAQLRISNNPLTSSDLRKLSTGVSGIRHEELGRALTRLLATNVVLYDQGRQNTKFWRLADRTWSGPSNTEVTAGNGTNGEQAHASQNAQSGHFKPAQRDVGKLGQPPNMEIFEPAQPAQSLPKQAAEPLLPPLRGQQVGKASGQALTGGQALEGQTEEQGGKGDEGVKPLNQDTRLFRKTEHGVKAVGQALTPGQALDAADIAEQLEERRAIREEGDA